MSLLYTGYKRSLVVEVYKNGGITSNSSYNGQQPFHAIGGQIYDLLTDDQFKVLSSEGYLQRLQDFQIYVSSLEAGISFIQDVPGTYASKIAGLNCTTTTTTTTTSTTSTTSTSTTTTTTTELPCDSPTSYTGGLAYPSTLNVNLSSSLGYVTLDFNAIGLPDQYIVIFDGNIVINTGYRGALTFDFGNSDRSFFISSLLGQIDPVGGTYPNYSLYPNDGYPRILGLGLGNTYFYKSTGTTSATVNVYAPMDGTSWSYTLKCPVVDEPTTTTTTTTTSTTTTSTTSTTSTSTTTTTTTI